MRGAIERANFSRGRLYTGRMPAQPASSWRLGADRTVPLDGARIMAIINVTPDSFSDGGAFDSVESAAAFALQAIEDGADLLDIGGESTRPGAAAVSDSEQIDRVTPVIRAIRQAGVRAPISVDTTRAAVAERALDAGADAVNDVSAGADDPALLPLIARRDCGVILMHRLRRPSDDVFSHCMTAPPDYGPDVVAHVRDALVARAEAASAAGVDRRNIAIDPGLGFGKSVGQNYQLLGRCDAFVATGYPVVAAASRKSFLGAVAGIEDPKARLAPSIAASVAQRLAGAAIFRVHDVRPHREALAVADAILKHGRSAPEVLESFGTK